jgi:hypothetical protein
MDMDIKLAWSSDDSAWCAVLVRDGEPWYLDGACVGMGRSPGEAVDDLLGIAGYLVEHGQNALTPGIDPDDRDWLFRLLDQGTAAAVQARYEAMRRAGLG